MGGGGQSEGEKGREVEREGGGRTDRAEREGERERDPPALRQPGLPTAQQTQVLTDRGGGGGGRVRGKRGGGERTNGRKNKQGRARR